jgi:hypothetical protein
MGILQKTVPIKSGACMRVCICVWVCVIQRAFGDFTEFTAMIFIGIGNEVDKI